MTMHDEKNNGQNDKINPVPRGVWIALAAVCAVSLAGHLALLPYMPETVPTHWDAVGNVDGWSNRNDTIGFAFLPLGLLALLYIVPKMDPRGRAYEKMGGFYTGFVVLFTLFINVVTWMTELTVFGFLPETDSLVSVATSVIVGVLFIMLGNYLPKVKRNYTFGIKTPWALDNDANWRLTHRFGGVVMLVAGVIMLACGGLSLVLGDFSVAAVLVAAIGGSIAIYIYSYLVFRNGNKPLRPR